MLKLLFKLASDNEGKLDVLRLELKKPDAPDISSIIATLIQDEAVDAPTGFRLLKELMSEAEAVDNKIVEILKIEVFIYSKHVLKLSMTPGSTIGDLRKQIGEVELLWSMLQIHHVEGDGGSRSVKTSPKGVYLLGFAAPRCTYPDPLIPRRIQMSQPTILHGCADPN